MRYIMICIGLCISYCAFASDNTVVSENIQAEEIEFVKAATPKRMFCRYCGALCMGILARREHEAECEKNPHIKPKDNN